MSIEYNGYKVESDGTFGYINVKPVGSGSVPKQLRGDYTSNRFAKLAIDKHGKVKDGKKERTSRI